MYVFGTMEKNFAVLKLSVFSDMYSLTAETSGELLLKLSHISHICQPHARWVLNSIIYIQFNKNFQCKHYTNCSDLLFQIKDIE